MVKSKIVQMLQYKF